MNKKLLMGFIAVLLLVCMSGLSQADDVTPNWILGSGNINGSLTVDQSNGIELGLRGKLRHNADGDPENTFNSNGDGTYSFAAGVAPTQSYPTAVWSIEWAINSDWTDSDSLSWKLNDLTYELGVDTDPSQATNFITSDPINVDLADHAIGNNSTANGAGIVAVLDTEYAQLLAENNVAQQSWKAHWMIDTIDPTVDGTYDFYLAAFGQHGAEHARTEIQIIVGNGAAPPATCFISNLW